MDEHNQNSEELEVAPQGDVSDESTHNEQNQNAEAVKKAEEQDRNWRNMRQRQKELELELQRKDEMIDRVLKSQPQQQSFPQVEEPEEKDDDFIPAGKVKGIARKSVQPLEKKIHELEQKIAQQEQQKRIKDKITHQEEVEKRMLAELKAKYEK